MNSNRYNPIDIDNAPIEHVLRAIEGQLIIIEIEGWDKSYIKGDTKLCG